MKSNFLASVAVSIALVPAIVASPATLADRIQYHGTECMTANVSQGELMSWNKDGLTNNAQIALFIICPINYDQRRLTSFSSPTGQMQASAYYPSILPQGTSASCLIRQGRALANGSASSDDQIFDLNMISLLSR